jgi:hypothetical protein
MKYSTRSFHPIEGPCEFNIYDTDPNGEPVQMISVVSAAGRLCAEEGTSWPGGIRRSSLSQATGTANDAVGALKRFRMAHGVMDETLAESHLRKHAPDLGALLGCGPEPLVDEALFAEQTAASNTEIAAAFDAGVPAHELQA